MGRTVVILIGLAMVVIGAIWTFQGLGYLEGSPMTGVKLWATVGPIVAGLGVALAIVGWRRPRG
jgi:ABC-type proline/glycine betaine transport system permease subunit